MGTRVRYAPSPTGFQHIGGLRTALINYLFAKHNNGTFIVRIEDTDRTRSKDIYIQDLFDSLAWLNLVPDESPKQGGKFGPYIQSERLEIYTQYAQKLLDQGDAYYCFTSINSQHNTSEEESVPYNRSSRNLSKEEIENFFAQGKQPVIRLKMPLEGEIVLEDEILGTIHRKVEDIIIDPIIIKSDSYPTYHFANVIDDHLMEITHVLRSQEWVPTTPVHIYLYKVFNWKPPKFCHLPMVLGDDGQKLSKRNGSISIQEIRKIGILPEALINSVALVGWSYDDSKEFFSIEELKELFNLSKINKAPAKFSIVKLKWFNATYIRLLPIEKLANLLFPYFIEKKWLSDNQQDLALLKKCIPLVQERIELLSDACTQLSSVFEDLSEINFNDLLTKNSKEVLNEGLTLASKVLDTYWDSSVEIQELKIREELKSYTPTLKLAQVFMPLRMAITGSTVSPPILPLIKLIKKETIFNRIKYALSILKHEEKL